MRLYTLFLCESALMNSYGFRNRPWAVCQMGTGAILYCYETRQEANEIVREWTPK
jgi:hypothetical protein